MINYTAKLLDPKTCNIGDYITDMHGARFDNHQDLNIKYRIVGAVEFRISSNTVMQSLFASVGAMYQNKHLIVLDVDHTTGEIKAGYSYDGARVGFCSLRPWARRS